MVDAEIGWVLAEDAAAGHVLALEHGEPGRRYVLCGEVASFGRVLHAFADRVGGRRVPTLPPGSTLGPGATTFARRSEVYGRFPPVRIDDAGARALGFRPCGVERGHRAAPRPGPARSTAPARRPGRKTTRCRRSPRDRRHRGSVAER